MKLVSVKDNLDKLLDPTESSIAYRPDIDGLRALAVTLVVSFHIGLPKAEGGFIGVDMFFVISGFLITWILALEFRRDNKIDFGRFWARRIRRLLPASAVTLVATVLLSWFLISPIAFERVIDTALYVVLYIPNFFLASEQGNYFASDTESNPLAHFWSLAVEEQFYLVWPVLIYALFKMGKKFASGLIVVGALVLIIFVSLVYSEILTSNASAGAYYSPFSRAWEFSIGGLLGLGMMLRGENAKRDVSHNKFDAFVSLVGLMLIGYSLLKIGERSFPGYSAIPGVFGTLALLYGNSSQHFVSRIFSVSLAQWLGKVSYGWYLWHWPLIVLGRIYFGELFGGVERLLSVLVALVLAVLSYRLVENPLRFNTLLIRKQAANYLLAATTPALAFVALLVLSNFNESKLDEPIMVELLSAAEEPEATLEKGCGVNNSTELIANDCIWGSPSADKKILLLGDSHAAQWLASLDELGQKNSVVVIGRFLPACPVINVGAAYSTESKSCLESQTGIREFVENVNPDLVVVAQWSGSLEVISEDVWVSGLQDFLKTMQDIDQQVFLIKDNPDLDFDPIECIARKGVAECEPKAENALKFISLQNSIEAKTIEHFKTETFDPVKLLCDTRCSLRYNGQLVFQDDNHLSSAVAAELMGELEEPLMRALDGSVSK